MQTEARPGSNGRPDRQSIREMFGRISTRYDLLNRILSAGIDRRWRAQAVRAAARGRPPGRAPMRVLDTCTGTGDLALAFARSQAPAAVAVGCDYAMPMLELFRKKVGRRGLGRSVRIAAGDSIALPFLADSFDVVSAAFGVRNVAVGAARDPRQGLLDAFAEMDRVLRPGGRVVILEFSTPPRAGRLLAFYFRRVLPIIGNLISGRGEKAYSYLPWSLTGFPQGRDFLGLLAGAGFTPLYVRPLTGGLVSLYVAEKTPLPDPQGGPVHSRGASNALQ